MSMNDFFVRAGGFCFIVDKELALFLLDFILTLMYSWLLQLYVINKIWSILRVKSKIVSIPELKSLKKYICERWEVNCPPVCCSAPFYQPAEGQDLLLGIAALDIRRERGDNIVFHVGSSPPEPGLVSFNFQNEKWTNKLKALDWTWQDESLVHWTGLGSALSTKNIQRSQIEISNFPVTRSRWVTTSDIFFMRTKKIWYCWISKHFQ